MAEEKKSPWVRHIHLWLALAAGLFFVLLSLTDFYELIELKTYDYRLILRNKIFGPPHQLPNLATIDVDDYSVDKEGRFEDWDRTYHARIIDIASALGARAIGVDFLMPEPSTPMIRENQVAESDVHSREAVLALFRNPDVVLSDACRKWNNVYFAQYLTEAETQDYDRSLRENPPRTEVEEHRFQLVQRFTIPITQDFQKEFVVGSQLWAPVDTFLATARGAGQVQPIPDMDGIVRRNRAFYVYDGRIFPSLSIVMAADYLGVPLSSFKFEPGRVTLPNAHIPGEPAPRDIVIPLGARGTILVNWAGDYRSTYRHFPYASVKTFWEVHQREQLAGLVKRDLARDPALLDGLMGGQIDLSEFTLSRMMELSRVPSVDVRMGLQDVAVALKMSGAVSRRAPVTEALRDAFGKTTGIPDIARWRALYEELLLNGRVADLFAGRPDLTLADAARDLNMPAARLESTYTKIRTLVSPLTGEIAPGNYPLWFFAQTRDGAPVAVNDSVNSVLASALKEFLRRHGVISDAVVTGIVTPTPDTGADLTNLAVRVIAFAAGYPEQDYVAVTGSIVQAALLEPLVAEGTSFDDIVQQLFQVSPSDLPAEVIQPYRDTYHTLWRNNNLAAVLKADTSLSVEAAADTLTVLLRKSAGNDSVAVSAVDIVAEHAILLKHLKEQGDIPPEAHPLVFNTVVVDGRPVFVSDFEGAVLFYGITSTGGHDRNPTPFEPRYPMVGMHLNLFNQVVTGGFLYQAPKWLDWAVILAVALLMGLLVPRMSPVNGGILAFAMVVVFLTSTVVLFAKGRIWIDTVGPFGAITFGYLVITVRNYIVGEKEKKFIKGAFSAYLAPEVVEIIANDPEGLKLGGSPEHITAFFSDVKGFSTISEALSPTELVNLLNEYLTEMCDIAFKYGATVDKFIGDAIVAFFGAPIKYEDHAVRACLCACEMQSRLAVLREKWKAEGKHEIYCRIGLNTGNAVIGNMGGRQRFNYTMMGDTVNLAARLESGAKQFGVYTMITDVTYNAARDVIEARELDRIVVIGKKEPVTIYEVLSKKGELDPKKKQIADFYAEGLAYYREQNWDAAVAKWRAAMAVDPDHPDATSGIFIKRVDAIRAGKVEIPKDWNGVWEMTEK